MNTIGLHFPQLDYTAAANRLRGVVTRTPLIRDIYLSKKYACNVFLKREDLQPVRSYKLRGAYNMISSLPRAELQKGVVCSSAGNHAQGVAYTCSLLNIPGLVFMPKCTPPQKVRRTAMVGEGKVKITLVGDTFDECNAHALQFAKENAIPFIPPFDDPLIIEGQATVGLEILEDLPDVNYIFIPVGGGGLAAGMGALYKTLSPSTHIIGLEPQGAPSMLAAISVGTPVTLAKIDCFVDGAAVKRVGDLTYNICSQVLDEMRIIPESSICQAIIDLYNESGIIAEPAGAISIACLDAYVDQVKGKNVVCIISGGNISLDRLLEVGRTVEVS